MSFDVVVIGSGPGGYVAAIRAAQLGLNTAIVEKDASLGGTCLNIGCIPSKALLDSSEHFHYTQHRLHEHGVKVQSVALDLATMMKRKNQVVGKLTQGIAHLMKKNKITVLQGYGSLKSPQEVVVTPSQGAAQTIQTRFIILATGSVVRELPHLKIDGQYSISSTEALSLQQVPPKMLVIGAGAIGLELGSVWQRLGSEVTVLEYADKIAGPMDAGLSKRLQQILQKQGLKFILQANVTSISAERKQVTYEDLKSKQQHQLDADVVLVAVGRKPFSEALGLEALGITTNAQGFVEVNQHWQTAHKNIYAIGDLIPGPMLAHKAEEEGVAVAEQIAKGYGHMNTKTIPSVIYTHPEFAAVGLTEQELKANSMAYKKGEFPFMANGRAQAMGETDGWVKILAHPDNDRILGAHIVGARASDILAEVIVAMELEGAAEDVARSFHAHPTLTEVVREAALAVDGRARQM